MTIRRKTQKEKYSLDKSESYCLSKVNTKRVKKTSSTVAEAFTMNASNKTCIYDNQLPQINNSNDSDNNIQSFMTEDMNSTS